MIEIYRNMYKTWLAEAWSCDLLKGTISLGEWGYDSEVLHAKAD